MSQRYCNNMDNYKDQCEVLQNSIEVGAATTYVEPKTPMVNVDSGIIALSPLCDQYNDMMKIDDDDDDDSLTTCSDEEIVESLYQNLFSIVLCLQIEESCNSTKTPLSAHCPGAPMKLTRLSRNIEGFQRKLF